MKVAIYGAGAIGALLGARLSEAGWEVSLIARGAHLSAIRNSGLRIVSDEFGDNTYQLESTDDPATIGPVDYQNNLRSVSKGQGGLTQTKT